MFHSATYTVTSSDSEMAVCRPPILSESFGDLTRAKMGMTDFILDHFAFVFSCESFGMGMNGMRSIYQALHVLPTSPESLKIMVDSAEWDTCFQINLLGSFLIPQDRTDQLILLCCVHSFASRVCLCQ